MPSKSRIISLWIDNLSFDASLQQVIEWGLKRQSKFICFANVHMVVEAYRDPFFNQDLQKAALVLPDGKPLAVACKWLYKIKQERIAGMDFMPALLAEADKLKAKIFLYGSTGNVLDMLVQKIRTKYPGVFITGTISPPFRELTQEETVNYIKRINDAEAHFIFVALGCPKQEKWMAENFKNISGILLGVGGAFPVVAEIQKRCPQWMKDYSLEWLYRLIQEPRRLFKRYFVTNTQFIFLFIQQFLKQNFNRKRRKD
jgi:N-acetylglucosaminyldiphosphoundecaprenol N-acetyl-beta-D-mannosaminyltransferase